MEKRVEVRTYRVTLICDECKEGEMLPTGARLLSDPPQYPHRCNRCGHTENLRAKKYPRIEYQESETK